MNVFDFIVQNNVYIIIGLAVFCIFLFILCITAFSKIGKLKNRMDSFMKAENGNDIEGMLSEYIKKVENADNHFEQVKSDVSSLKSRIVLCIQKVGVVRFNPFDDVGGDLSFAAAFLDENNDGVVISSIYSRESSYSYAKEIKNGDGAKHKLSDEEKQAVNIALKR